MPHRQARQDILARHGSPPRGPTAARHATLPVGVGLDHAGVDREALATDQPLVDAALHGRLEHLAQQIALAETAVPVLREGRVIRHRTIETEPAEPAVAEVQVNFLAQPPLRADAKAVADDQHPDHQLRVDRRPSHFAVKRRQFAPYPVEVDKPVDRSQQVLRRHMAFERELVEQSFLPASTFPHHRLHSGPPDRIESAPLRAGNSVLFQHNRPSLGVG
jgi:hypothetical protein